MTHTCHRCGRPVDCADATDARDVAAILLAHLALDCTGEEQAVDNPVDRERIEP